MITTVHRGTGPRQIDIHLEPVWVEAGEDNVLVESGRVSISSPRRVLRVDSFLGVMPGDEVEVAVDVVNEDTQVVLACRSLHKECRGIYDAWATHPVQETAQRVIVTFTCRVNGPNRDGEPKSFFEGLARLTFEENR